MRRLVADEQRTSLAGPVVPAERAGEEGSEEQLPERRPAEIMRDLLPAIEHERRLNDWGRSERVEGFMDRTLIEFFYRYWFRTEVEGIDNVPSESGALVVSNHAGALPPDAAMIAKAIREEHPNPRPLYLTVEHFFKGYPGFSMLIPKVAGLIYFPITPTFPWLGPLGMLGYLPAKFKIRFLEPIDTVELGGAEAAEDKALVQTVAQEVRARIQENVDDMVAKRKSVWFG